MASAVKLFEVSGCDTPYLRPKTDGRENPIRVVALNFQEAEKKYLEFAATEEGKKYGLAFEVEKIVYVGKVIC